MGSSSSKHPKIDKRLQQHHPLPQWAIDEDMARDPSSDPFDNNAFFVFMKAFPPDKNGIPRLKSYFNGFPKGADPATYVEDFYRRADRLDPEHKYAGWAKDGSLGPERPLMFSGGDPTSFTRPTPSRPNGQEHQSSHHSSNGARDIFWQLWRTPFRPFF